MWASDNGHVEVVEELLQHGARVDSQDKVLYNQLCTILFIRVFLLEWVEFTDVGIAEWTCGDGGQVITTWSHNRLANEGTLACMYVSKLLISSALVLS